MNGVGLAPTVTGSRAPAAATVTGLTNRGSFTFVVATNAPGTSRESVLTAVVVPGPVLIANAGFEAGSNPGPPPGTTRTSTVARTGFGSAALDGRPVHRRQRQHRMVEGQCRTGRIPGPDSGAEDQPAQQRLLGWLAENAALGQGNLWTPGVMTWRTLVVGAPDRVALQGQGFRVSARLPRESPHGFLSSKTDPASISKKSRHFCAAVPLLYVSPKEKVRRWSPGGRPANKSLAKEWIYRVHCLLPHRSFQVRRFSPHG
jgi:hypothetical protein